jgi:GxxExxY protein
MLEQEGYEVMGAAFEVYNTLGCGFLEEVYQKSLEVELGRRSIPFRAQQELMIYYKDVLLEKRYIMDLVAYGGIIVELKAVRELTADHVAQIVNYLKAGKKQVGYLINFGRHDKLEWKRVIFTPEEKKTSPLIFTNSH